MQILKQLIQFYFSFIKVKVSMMIKLHVRSSFSKHRNECRNKDIFSWRLDEIRSIRVKHDSQKMYIVQ